MRYRLIAVAIASALFSTSAALAQQRMEAVVTVTKLDPASRMVWVETKSAKRTFNLSPDIDLSNLQVGSRYHVQWNEGVAIAIEPGGQSASSGATREVDVTKTGPGMGTGMAKVSGIVDSLDAAGQKITLRTADGDKETFAIGPNVSPVPLKSGDPVTLTYERSLAVQARSTPQPVSDPAPAQ